MRIGILATVATAIAIGVAVAGGGGGGACLFPSCFPDATNTGVPSGTSLTAYSGPTSITVANTVIDSKTITSCLSIEAANVTIRNSLVDVGGCAFTIEVFVPGATLTIEDAEIDCQGTGENGLSVNDSTATRLNIHDCENGVNFGDHMTLTDSYIHDLNGPGPDPHIDGIQAAWGADSTIRHNTILSRDTSSIIMTNYDGHPTVDNWTITENLMGAQTAASVANVIYCPAEPVSNAFITNNHFKTQFPPVGNYSTGCNVAGLTWSGNVSQETGDPIVVDQPG